MRVNVCVNVSTEFEVGFVQWLTYWVIYSLVQLVDSVLGFVLAW